MSTVNHFNHNDGRTLMNDIAYCWSTFMADYMAAHPNADWDDVERDRLNGSLFDPDDPYLVDLAARVLAEEGDDCYEEAA